MAVWKSCCVGMWLAVAMAFSVNVWAQTTTAALRGKTSDQQGATLPGVAITAHQIEEVQLIEGNFWTSQPHKLRSSQSGSFHRSRDHNPDLSQ
jgi:hypothetical protein